MNDQQRMTEPSWLTAKVDQRLAYVEESGVIDVALASGAEPLITLYLTEPTPGVEPNTAAWERWERACDNCDVYVPIGAKLMSGHVFREIRGQRLVITFACCETCCMLP